MVAIAQWWSIWLWPRRLWVRVPLATQESVIGIRLRSFFSDSDGAFSPARACRWRQFRGLPDRTTRLIILWIVITQVHVLIIKLPVRNCLEFDLYSRVAGGNPLYQMDIDDPVVINTQRIEQGILGNF